MGDDTKPFAWAMPHDDRMVFDDIRIVTPVNTGMVEVIFEGPEDEVGLTFGTAEKYDDAARTIRDAINGKSPNVRPSASFDKDKWFHTPPGWYFEFSRKIEESDPGPEQVIVDHHKDKGDARPIRGTLDDDLRAMDRIKYLESEIAREKKRADTFLAERDEAQVASRIAKAGEKVAWEEAANAKADGLYTRNVLREAHQEIARLKGLLADAPNRARVAKVEALLARSDAEVSEALDLAAGAEAEALNWKRKYVAQAGHTVASRNAVRALEERLGDEEAFVRHEEARRSRAWGLATAAALAAAAAACFGIGVERLAQPAPSPVVQNAALLEGAF